MADIRNAALQLLHLEAKKLTEAIEVLEGLKAGAGRAFGSHSKRVGSKRVVNAKRRQEKKASKIKLMDGHAYLSQQEGDAVLLRASELGR